MVEELLQKFGNLRIWKKRCERAPHKPLLVLWAIGQCLQGRSRLLEYDEIHEVLTVLLERFGPPRKAQAPQEPFWRLQRDGIWEVSQADQVPVQSGGSVSPASLRLHNASGGFPLTLYNTFRNDHEAALTVARQLVETHFPETMHSVVLEATLGAHPFLVASSTSSIGDSKFSPLIASTYRRRLRNPKFRYQVLEQYGHKCAICGYSFEYPKHRWPALEAAHIRWHSHDGPDASENGLSLCVLHHELFDWGIYTIEPDTLQVTVAAAVREQAAESSVIDLHGNRLRALPKLDSARPATKHLAWHARNVFRGV